MRHTPSEHEKRGGERGEAQAALANADADNKSTALRREL